MLWRSILAITIIVLAAAPAISAGTWNGWIYQDPYPTDVNLFDVHFTTPEKGWIAGKYGSILYTGDGGENWESQDSGTEEDLLRVCFVNDKAGWAVGKGGTIVHTSDGGKTWVNQGNVNALLTKVFFLDEKEGWVTGGTPMGVLYHTTDGGKTWQDQEPGIDRAIGSVFFLNPQTGWLLAGEDVYRTADGGKQWERSKLPIGNPPWNGRTLESDLPDPMGEGLGFGWWYGDIAFANEKQGWAVANQGSVFHTDDGGMTWTAQLDTGTGSYGFSHISFRDAQNGCVSGSTIYCTEDGGKNWNERLGIRPGDGRALGGISLIDKSSGWVVGNFGQIWKSTDGGRSWADIKKWDECGKEPFFVNEKTGWLYTWRRFDKLCRTDDGGRTWKKQEVGIKVNDVFFADSSTGWAVGMIEEWQDDDKEIYLGDPANVLAKTINVWGVIKNTTDGGKTWKIQYKQSMGEDGWPGLNAISFLGKNKGWAVGKGGTILNTIDGGKSWVLKELGDDGLYLDKVGFIDANIGWITGTQANDEWIGFVLSTEDGGKNWKVQQKIKDVGFDDLHFEDKRNGWIGGQAEYGEIGVLLHTQDSGKTWSEQEFENIGYNHMVFLDEKRGVIYSLITGLMLTTEDGGKTWGRRRVPLKKYPWHFSEIFKLR